MKKLIAFAIASFLIIISAKSQHQLQLLWQTDSVFKVPESVLFDAKRKTLYVANIEGKEPWGKDSVGSISKLSVDGQMMQHNWVSGLNAPKGMGIWGNSLFVADIDRVAQIDLKKGLVPQFIAVEGALRLNDIVVNDKGVVYVSDIRGRSVYAIEKGIARKIADSTQLKRPNGVAWYNQHLHVVDDSLLLRQEANGSFSQLATGLQGFSDGLEPMGNGDFLVSGWEGIIWYVYADGRKEKLSDTRAEKYNTADIGYDPKTKTVFVPGFWRNTVKAFGLK